MYMYVRVYIYTHTNTRKDKKWRKVFFFRQTINYIIQIQQLEKKKFFEIDAWCCTCCPAIWLVNIWYGDLLKDQSNLLSGFVFYIFVYMEWKQRQWLCTQCKYIYIHKLRWCDFLSEFHETTRIRSLEMMHFNC